MLPAKKQDATAKWWRHIQLCSDLYIIHREKTHNSIKSVWNKYKPVFFFQYPFDDLSCFLFQCQRYSPLVSFKKCFISRGHYLALPVPMILSENVDSFKDHMLQTLRQFHDPSRAFNTLIVYKCYCHFHYGETIQWSWLFSWDDCLLTGRPTRIGLLTLYRA